MGKTILQTAKFEGVSPEDLFRVYMDPQSHGAAIGAPVVISDKPGADFQAFGGGVHGKMLHVVPNHQVVQTWRAQPWTEVEPDSILVLTFSPAARGAQVELVQAGVPDHAYEIIDSGWKQRYWEPWAGYLRGR